MYDGKCFHELLYTREAIFHLGKLKIMAFSNKLCFTRQTWTAKGGKIEQVPHFKFGYGL